MTLLSDRSTPRSRAVRRLNADPQAAATMPVRRLITMAASVMAEGTPAVVEEVLVRVWTAGTEADAWKFLRAMSAGLDRRFGPGPTHTADDPTGEYRLALERACNRVINAWRSKRKEVHSEA